MVSWWLVVMMPLRVFGYSNIDLATLQAQQAQVQAQIFALSNSPYGDSPLFRNIAKVSESLTE